MKRSSSTMLGKATMLVALMQLLAACTDEASSSSGGSGGDDGSGAGAGVGGAGGAGGGMGGGTIVGGPKSCAELGDVDADYPGLDEGSFASTTPAEGCVEGFDFDSHAFAIGFEGNLRISFEAGSLAVNGTKCTAPGGADVPLDADMTISIAGSDADDRVLFDLSGWVPSVLDAEGDLGLIVDLGDGNDLVFVKGSTNADAVVASTVDGALALDVDADGELDARFGSADVLAASLGPGNDRFDAGAPDAGAPIAIDATICAGAGDDDLRGGTGLDKLEGGAGDDVLRATAAADGSDLYDGGEGDDTADFSARVEGLTITLDDTQNDGEGAEEDNVRANVERVFGGAGDDTIVGNDANEHLAGGAGEDTLEGRGGDDVIDGDDGDDEIVGSPTIDGADVINGGNGMDTIFYTQRPSGITVTPCTSTVLQGCDAADGCVCDANDGEAGELDNLVNVEGIHGTMFADVMTGDASGNQFYGYDGDDLLVGNAGDDSLFGDVGDDDLDGGLGDDYLDGGDGMDAFGGGDGQGDICIIGPAETAPQCELY